MRPVVDRLKKEYAGRVEIVLLKDGQEATEKAQQFGVQYVPTFVFLKADGTRIDQVVGGMSEEQMRQKLDALL